MSDLEQEIAALKAENARLREAMEKPSWLQKAKRWAFKNAFLSFIDGGDIYAKWCALVEALERGEKAPSKELKEFTGTLWHRFTKIGLLGIFATLLPAIFTGIQLYHMSRQSEHMARQSELIQNQELIIRSQTKEIARQSHLASFEQTSKLRAMLLDGKDTTPPRMGEFWPQPNMSVVEQIAILGRSEPGITLEAINPLLKDENGTVTVGAALVLSKMNQPIKGGRFWAADFSRLDFQGDIFENCVFDTTLFRATNLRGSFIYNCLFSAVVRHRNPSSTFDVIEYFSHQQSPTFDNLNLTESLIVNSSIVFLSHRDPPCDSIFFDSKTMKLHGSNSPLLGFRNTTFINSSINLKGSIEYSHWIEIYTLGDQSRTDGAYLLWNRGNEKRASSEYFDKFSAHIIEGYLNSVITSRVNTLKSEQGEIEETSK